MSLPLPLPPPLLLALLLLSCMCLQMLMRGYILRHGYETSYTCLARRAAKSNNIWNRLVRRGSITRRICMYGLLQLAFTVICCTLFLPTYFSFWAALVYQVGWRVGQDRVRWRSGVSIKPEGGFQV